MVVCAIKVRFTRHLGFRWRIGCAVGPLCWTLVLLFICDSSGVGLVGAGTVITGFFRNPCVIVAFVSSVLDKFKELQISRS